MIRGRPRFDEDTHTYWLGRYEVPGTTAICKAAGLFDEKWIPESARDRGSAIHKLTERHDLGLFDLNTYEGEYREWCLQYLRFLEEEDPQWDAIERACYHRRHGYGTIVDRAGSLRGHSLRGPIVVNIKTGAHQDFHDVQSAGELIAYDGRWSRRGRVTLYLTQRKYKIEVHTHDGDRERFLDALSDWRKQCHNDRRHPPLRLLSDLSRATHLRSA